MHSRNAKRLKKGDIVLSIGLDKVERMVVEGVSEHGCCNLHTEDNRAHFFRDPSEMELIKPLSKADDSDACVYFHRMAQKIAEEHDALFDEVIRFNYGMTDEERLNYKFDIEKIYSRFN